MASSHLHGLLGEELAWLNLQSLTRSSHADADAGSAQARGTGRRAILGGKIFVGRLVLAQDKGGPSKGG